MDPCNDAEKQQLLPAAKLTDYNGTDPEVTSLGAESEESIRQATFFGGVMNLCNTILGAGLLALPSAFAQCGYVLGTVMLCLGAAGSALSLHLLGMCAHKVGGCNTSFHVMSCHSYPSAAALADLAVAIKCFGVACSYLVVLGDLLPSVATAIGGAELDGQWVLLSSRHFWITIAMALLIVPMAFQRHLYALRYMSFFAVTSVCYVSLMVVLYKFVPSLGVHAAGGQGDVGAIEAVVSRLSTLHALPVFVFSFTCHQNIFAIYNEMAVVPDRRPMVLNRIIVTAIGIALGLYLLVSNCAYLTYGNLVAANLLENYPLKALPVLAARCTMAFLVTCCYPLQCHPCRQAVTKLIHNVFDSRGLNRPPAMALFIAITTVFLLASYIIALLVTDLGKVFAVVGATGSTTISYILPGLFFAKMFEGHPEHSTRRSLAKALVVGGLVIMSCSLTFQALPSAVMCRVLEPGARSWVDAGCAQRQ